MPDSQEFDISDLKVFADEANVFMKQLMEESDRGAALVGVAYLDELLARLFRAQTLTEKVSEELFGRFGPLSSFSSRIDVAYCLGWIGRETHRDLNLLRKIRNEFAHAHGPVTFADAAVKARCSELQIPKGLDFRVAPRDQFLFAASMLALRLEYYRRDSKAPTAKWDPPVEPFIPPTPEDK